MHAAPLAVPAVLASFLALAPAPETPADLVHADDDVVVCPDQVVHAPILVMDELGDALGLPTHRELTVWDDGTVRLGTSITAMGFSELLVAQADDAQLARLLPSLAAAGAWELCDKPEWGSPLPLVTVALLRGGPDGVPHSFSFRGDEPEYAAVGQVLADFRAALFHQ